MGLERDTSDFTAPSHPYHQAWLLDCREKGINPATGISRQLEIQRETDKGIREWVRSQCKAGEVERKCFEIAAEIHASDEASEQDLDRRIQRTAARLSEITGALPVPDLDDETKRSLLTEAVVDTMQTRGAPRGDQYEQLCFDEQADRTFSALCALAQEQRATPEVRGKLLERRMLRRPGLLRYLGSGV